MPTTFQALAVLVLALLPGALYVWCFEREAGLWGINLPDRLLRFLGVSALLQVLALPVTYWAWYSYVRDKDWESHGHLPWPLYFVLLGYIAVPVVLGLWLGHSATTGGRAASLIHGHRPAPRAWDFFFSKRPDGWIRLKLKSGTWVGGAYAKGSYAAGYPEPQDIYISEVVEIDPETGEFEHNGAGEPLLRGSSLLASWEDIEYLEFADA